MNASRYVVPFTLWSVPFDPCTICGGTLRPVGAGLLECDWCGQTVRAVR